jgi:hypothetical protein
MMLELARTHNSMAVKRGYLIFIIFFLFMPHDRSFIRYFCLYRYRHCMVCRIDVLPYIRAFMRKLGLPKQDKRGTGAMSCGDEALAKLAEKEPMVRPIASRVAEYRSCETIAANALKTGPFRRHRQDERFADEPQCGGYPDLLDQLLLDANAAQLHCSSIDIPVQPGDEGVLVIRAATDKSPVM